MEINDVNVKKDVKILFMGTPEFSVPVLSALIKNYNVRAIVTQPDRRVGRDMKVVFSPIKQVGIDNTILVLQPEKIRENVDMILELNPDLIITCAYGQILPKRILECPRLGCINVHASLLPKLRGGAPIHRAIINGFKKTGITIMYMDEKMDEGDIISQREVDILDTDTASSLHDKLSAMGASLLLDTLPSIIDGTNERIKQDNSQSSYGFVIKSEDEKLDFSKTKREFYNQIRGLNSWPGAYCLYDGMRLKVYECYKSNNIFSDKLDGEITCVYSDGFGVKVSDGELVFTLVQPDGKGRMSGADFARGQINKGNFVGRVLE